MLVRKDVARPRTVVRSLCQPGQRRAVGRGGDWRRRAEPLLEKVVDR